MDTVTCFYIDTQAGGECEARGSSSNILVGSSIELCCTRKLSTLMACRGKNKNNSWQIQGAQCETTLIAFGFMT